MKFSKIGMRTVKTVIAVLLTLLAADLLKLNSPILAGIAAIMTMETTVSESFTTAKYRMYGTVLGAVVGLIITLIAPENFIVVGIGLIIIIYICNMFRWDQAVRMSMVVFLVIILDYEVGYRFTYALNRICDTFVGVIVGTSVNYFLRPPKLEIDLKKTINIMYLEIKSVLEKLIWKEEVMIEDLRKKISEIDEKYKALRRELKYDTHIQENIANYKDVFNLFEKVENHIFVISPLNKNSLINDNNKKALENMFLKKIPVKENIESSNTDIIYNYHLDKIISSLNNIDVILNKKIS